MQSYLDREEVDYLLTLDYDSIFRSREVLALHAIMEERPDIDAVAAVQVRREHTQLLMSLVQDDGSFFPEGTEIDEKFFEKPLCRARTAHFGLTMFRKNSLKRFSHPWFQGVPNEQGLWDEGKIDPDIHFWHKWREEGFTVYIANRVLVGHAQLMIAWPTQDGGICFQFPNDYSKHERPPNGAWK